ATAAGKGQARQDHAEGERPSLRRRRAVGAPLPPTCIRAVPDTRAALIQPGPPARRPPDERRSRIHGNARDPRRGEPLGVPPLAADGEHRVAPAGARVSGPDDARAVRADALVPLPSLAPGLP